MTAEPIAARHVRKNSSRVKRWLSNPLGATGAMIVLVFAFTAIFAPMIATPQGSCARDLNVEEGARPAIFTLSFFVSIFAPPQSCFEIPQKSFAKTPTPPGEVAPLGTVNGYDIWYGLIWGSRTAFGLGISIIGVTFLVGTLIGSLAGFYGGWLDDVLMRVTDIVFALPGFVLTVVLVTILGQGLNSVIISIILVGWAGYARIMRGEVLRVRNLEYIEGARALGANDARIILRHVLPNSLTIISVQVALDFGSVVLTAAGLSFIGLGAPIGFADWGQLINFSQAFIIGPPGQPWAYWFVSFFPGLTILLWGLGWNFLGDALRDALDPKSRS